MLVDTFCSQLRKIFNASWSSGVRKFDSFFPLSAQRSKKTSFYLLCLFVQALDLRVSLQPFLVQHLTVCPSSTLVSAETYLMR